MTPLKKIKALRMAVVVMCMCGGGRGHGTWRRQVSSLRMEKNDGTMGRRTTSPDRKGTGLKVKKICILSCLSPSHLFMKSPLAFLGEILR